MKAVILDGSRKGDDSLSTAQRIILDELTGMGWEVETFILHALDISYCRGCFECWVKTPGVCVSTGVGRDIAGAVIRSDLTVFLTPITFGGYSSELKKAVDHLIGLVSPFFMRIGGETHHKPRYAKYPRLLGVGALPTADEESERIFTTLVERNAINMHSPSHAAGVILSGWSAAEVRAGVQSLLMIAA
jgi:multimeric flavodoxin WrbA